MQSAVIISTAILVISCLAPIASAEEQHVRQGFWFGLDAGAGHLKQSFDDRNDEDIYFFLGFKGGYAINPHFLMGLELSGWLLEAEDTSDSNKGKGIMQAFLIGQLYPSKESGLYLKAGGGYVENWSNRSGEPNSKKGWGFTLGCGYDFIINDLFPDQDITFGPFANFSYGETGSWDHRAITVGISLGLP
jgi:hypothetical protein